MLTALYVPGSRPDRFDKALRSGADAVVLDLEDAVPASGKSEARAAVRSWLSTLDATAVDVEVWIRVNNDPALLDDDLTAVANMRIAGVWLPKCEEVGQIDHVGSVLSRQQDERVLAVSPLIETGLGVLNAVDLARANRVSFLQIGEYDLAAELGLDPSPEGAELSWARGMVVAASAAAGLVPPLAAVSVETRDQEAFSSDTERLRRMGFWGRACIHPAQLQSVIDVFRPTAEQVAWAEKVLSQMEVGAVSLTGDGELVDEAIARRARRVLASARIA